MIAFALASEPGALTIPLSMLAVFGTAKLLAEVFERLNMPGIAGEILAGVLIGPSVLNWIRPNEILESLAELGVMFLLFNVGLEVKGSELLRVGKLATSVAVLGVVLPFAVGWAIMRAYGYPQAESMFVGAAMVATSVGITAQILGSKGLLHLDSSKIILGAAVIDDILGLIVLAVVSSSAKGTVNYFEIALIACLAIAFTLIVAKWGTRTMRSVVPRAEARLKAGEVQFNLALCILFALSVLAVYAGVAAIIGAFLAGMALSDSLSPRVHDLSHGITELLVPFFLAGIGLKLSFEGFGDPHLITVAALIIVAAIATKLIGCGIGALPLGRKAMFQIGAGMVPRGEVGMVVAQIGLSLKVVEQNVYGVVVVMAVVTTIVAPILLKMAYKGAEARAPEEKFGIG